MLKFSLSHCLSPLVGLSGKRSIALLYFCRTALALTYLPFWYGLVYHVPSTLGALYLGSLAQEATPMRKRLFFILSIALCYLLFLVHPVGSQAAAYTIFWLIPLAVLIMPASPRGGQHWKIFSHALGATFMTHAVGSVIWLYAINGLSSAGWLALMPVVCLERLLFASGMVAVISGGSILKRLVYTYSTRRYHTSTFNRFLSL